MGKNYDYGGKATALNGVWMWLQEFEEFKCGKHNSDISYKLMIQVVNEFLLSVNIKPIKNQNLYNCQKVQKRWTDFKKYIESKYTKEENLWS